MNAIQCLSTKTFEMLAPIFIWGNHRYFHCENPYYYLNKFIVVCIEKTTLILAELTYF